MYVKNYWLLGKFRNILDIFIKSMLIFLFDKKIVELVKKGSFVKLGEKRSIVN